jgi:hypothetical protein
MQKTFLKRVAKGKYMPTPQELLEVVKRQGLSGLMTVPKLYALPQEPNPPEDGNKEDEDYQAEVQEFRKLLSEIEAKNRKIAPKIREAQANNAHIQRNREILMWYWLELLPDVVGKHTVTGATIFADGIHSPRAVFQTIQTRNTSLQVMRPFA